MRHMLRITVRVALLVACLAGRVSAADAARGPAKKTSSAAATADAPLAEQLVRKALEAELAGDAAERARLLDAAIQEDTGLDKARWQNGQLKLDGKWLSIADVARTNAENARLTQYHRRREMLIDSAESQRDLARWCSRYHLADEAAVHWQAVLGFLPDDAEAIRALKLKEYDGRLLNPRELTAAKAQAAREREAARHWQPQILRWRDAIVTGSDTERQQAIDGLLTIRDPAAIPVLRATLLSQNRAQKSDKLYPAYIAVLKQMPEEQATQELVRCVLDGDSGFADPALKGRPLASYVPQLIAALPVEAKISGKADIFFSPSGYVLSEHQWKLEVPEANYTETQIASHSRMTVLVPGPRGGLNGAAQQLPGSVQNDVLAAVGDVQQFKRAIEEQQRRSQESQARQKQLIENALLASTDFEKETTREAWLAQLNRALETYSPASFPPTGPRNVRRVTENMTVRILRGTSCFPAGTLVESITGPVAIETLKPGDRVLSQDVETGELAYQAVREVTLRPAVPLVEIEAGGATVRATPGHPFWINGDGWVMAKHLKPGQHLHTPNGPLQIERIGEQPAQEAYNLVVSDFATYFVGPQHILVHDNQPLTGTSVLVPGLVARDLKP